MKWRGETEHQWKVRTAQWHDVFCWLPRQMRNGNWVWLEPCWAKRGETAGGRAFWQFSDSLRMPEDVRPQTPPPMQKR